MTIEEDIQESELELSQLKEELKTINKHLLNKKMENSRFKELMAEKSEIEKEIAEVELEIDLLKTELTSNQQTNS